MTVADEAQSDDALFFSRTASITSPYRAEQMGMLFTLIPFDEEESFKIVDLGCGDGKVSECLLRLFPASTVIALDRSAAIRDLAAERLQYFGERAMVMPFEFGNDLGPGFLHEEIWLPHLIDVDLVVASHFGDFLRNKPALTNLLLNALSDRGAMLIADLGDAQTPDAAEAYLAEWSKEIRSKSLPSESAEIAEDWAWKLKVYYTDYPYCDGQLSQSDRRNSLLHDLVYLSEFGFKVVDCFWRRAGHTVYGGMRRIRKGCTIGRHERSMKLARAMFDVPPPATP
ncbi:MAG TPA: class I SAM-dependent methyltransferase [Chroococcales cyanobacterium]